MTSSPLYHTAVPPRLILHTLIRRTRGHAIAWPEARGTKAGGDPGHAGAAISPPVIGPATGRHGLPTEAPA